MTDLLWLTSLPLEGEPLTPLSRICPGQLREGLLLCVILRESWMPKAFPAISFWVTVWLSLRCLPVAGCGRLEMDLTLSAWTANIGTDPFQSGKGPELRKKKYSTTSCPRANATCASEKYTCSCVWCASLRAFNCHEHELACRHLVNKLTVSQ